MQSSILISWNATVMECVDNFLQLEDFERMEVGSGCTPSAPRVPDYCAFECNELGWAHSSTTA